ncbi:hypothetical protein [Saccharopolyspora sp. NPDC050642]|uniref:hypothetical protein n=1 Tax=Saccharopolyspora sp. NPDC050642 TaxID=3157099 RepID=UPI0033D4D55D
MRNLRAGRSEAERQEELRRRREGERLWRERNKLIADAEVLLGDAQARLAALPEWDGSRQAELGRIDELQGVLDELRKDSGSSDEASAGEPAAASVPDAARETESGAREKEERASLAEWVAQVRASLEEVQSRQAWFALQDADFVLQVESGLPMFDEAMRDEREDLQRQLGKITEDVVVELNRSVGLLDGHLAALPADFRPDVRTKVDDARQ